MCGVRFCRRSGQMGAGIWPRNEVPCAHKDRTAVMEGETMEEGKIRLCSKCQAWTVGTDHVCGTCGGPLIPTDYSDLYWGKLEHAKREKLTNDILVALGFRKTPEE